MNRGAWMATVGRVAESDVTEHAHTSKTQKMAAYFEAILVR